MTFKIVFLCVGAYCGDGADLGWYREVTFPSLETCRKIGDLVLLHVFPPAGMEIKFSCELEGQRT